MLMRDSIPPEFRNWDKRQSSRDSQAAKSQFKIDVLI